MNNEQQETTSTGGETTKAPFSFADLRGQLSGIEWDEQAPLMSEPEKNSDSRTQWEPNTDEARSLISHTVLEEGTPQLKLSRYGTNNGEGFTANKSNFLETTGMKLKDVPGKTQVTLILGDGKTMVLGYVQKPEIKGAQTKLYFPLKYWPENLELPEPGHSVKLTVRVVVLG